MRLAVFLNLRFYENNGLYRADEPYFRFWVRLAERFSHVTLCVPTATSATGGLHPVVFDPLRVSVCPLPMYSSSLDLYLKFPYFAASCARKCSKTIRDSDVFVSVIPNLLGLWLGFLAEKYGTPCAYYLRGDLERTVHYEYRDTRFSFFPLALSHLLERMARRRMKRRPCFVVGGELHEKYLSHGISTVPIVTSLISDRDLIDFVPIKGLGKQVTLLSVGRLSPERGVETLLQSLSLLGARRPGRFRCMIVGDGPQRRPLEQEAARLGLSDVIFKGYIPYGDKLTELYAEADVFVLPSYTEGFPKVILEAMANAVPVVGTGVGGIPYVLKSGHDCLLVAPGVPGALAEALIALAGDVDLYNLIGLNAGDTIRTLTYERQSEIFIRHIQNLAV